MGSRRQSWFFLATWDKFGCEKVGETELFSAKDRLAFRLGEISGGKNSCWILAGAARLLRGSCWGKAVLSIYIERNQSRRSFRFSGQRGGKRRGQFPWVSPPLNAPKKERHAKR